MRCDIQQVLATNPYKREATRLNTAAKTMTIAAGTAFKPDDWKVYLKPARHWPLVMPVEPQPVAVPVQVAVVYKQMPNELPVTTYWVDVLDVRPMHELSL